MKSLIVGNWKMHGSLEQARDLARTLDLRAAEQPLAKDVVLCPPFPYLSHVNHCLVGSSLMLGAQDCHTQSQGAFTGDVSASMLKDVGCRFVILGHSERRLNHQETSALIAEKAASALEAGLHVIICIGETREEREAGKAFDILDQQLRESLPQGATSDLVTVAYEPVWAIGTGLIPSEKDLEEAFAFLRNHSSIQSLGADHTRLLYGGSVKGDNAGSLLKIRNIDGLLVGGASLKAEEFWSIITSD